jgi:hypothetical protein
MKRFFTFAATVVFGIVGVGCGGGGGGSDPAPVAVAQPAGQAVVVQPVLVLAPSTIVTVAATNSYPALSEESLAFELLNAERGRCGFGTVFANTQLNGAAKAHADYQLINNLDSHSENASLYPNGFTGVDGAARVLFQGYTGAGAVADEYTFAPGVTSKTGIGTNGIRALLAAPYHLSGVMSGYRDVGIAIRSSTDVSATNPAVFAHINAAYKIAAGPQLQAGDEVKTYPCDGSTGLNRRLASEVPNPVPGRNLATNPLGPSIYVQLREGNALTITRATMTQKSNGAVVVLRSPVISTNDTNAVYKGHQGVVTADAPVATNSDFIVTIEGTNNGTAFPAKSFTFTTGVGG